MQLVIYDLSKNMYAYTHTYNVDIAILLFLII